MDEEGEVRVLDVEKDMHDLESLDEDEEEKS